MAISTSEFDQILVAATESGPYSPIDEITDASFSKPKAVTETVYLGKKSSRATVGAVTPNLSLSVDFSPNDTAFQTLKTAYDSGSDVYVQVVYNENAVAPASKGDQLAMKVGTFDLSFPASGNISVSMTLHGNSDIEPIPAE